MSLIPIYALHVVVMLEALIPLFMLSAKLPKRGDRAPRRLACAALFTVIAVIPLVFSDPTDSRSTRNLVHQLLFFTTLLAGMTAMVSISRSASVWTSLFCSTAAYTAQNISSSAMSLVRLTALGSDVSTFAEPLNTIASIMVFGSLYALFYLLFVRRVQQESLLAIKDPQMLLLFAVVSLGVIGFDVLIKSLMYGGVGFVQTVLLRLVHLLVCVFVLFSEYQILYEQKSRADAAVLERILAERARQYEESRQNIDAINVKCHDIRHQIELLAKDGGSGHDALASLAEEVSIYDSHVRTGNDVLDTVLSEKSLLCHRSGVTLSCIADGSALAHMSSMDIYSLFGNALDNALSAVRRLPDPEQRSISVIVRRHGSMVSIHVENRFEGHLVFESGLPVTTNSDKESHGFGTKSMRLVAQKYEGTLTMNARNGLFQTDIIMPIPN